MGLIKEKKRDGFKIEEKVEGFKESGTALKKRRTAIDKSGTVLEKKIIGRALEKIKKRECFREEKTGGL